MSPSSLRVLAGAAAAVFALLTAIAVGLVSRPTTCGTDVPVQSSTAPVTPATTPPPAPSSSRPDALGNAVGGVSERSTAAKPPVETAAATTPAVVAQPATCEQAMFAPAPAVTALAGAGLTGAAVLVLLLLAARLTPTRAPVEAPRPPPAATPRAEATGSRPDTALLADRAALVRVCIYVRDRVTSRALADRLATALNDAGIVAVEPVGDRFDPARHEAGGATPTRDPKLVGTIAAVEVPGYTDRGGRVLRPPIVTVYQAATGRPTQLRRDEEDR
jgi:hypothetical protein